MWSLKALVPLAALSLAQHLNVDIPSVNEEVAHILSEFHDYIGTGPAPSASHKSPVEVAPEATFAQDSGSCSYWLGNISHQGIAAFNSNPSGYQVFRNVMNFGAKGDGVTDDTAAINAAISSGNRCAPGSCQSTTTTPAVVYFPAGTYLVSSPIVDYYYTQLIGNPNCVPTIKASSGFSDPGGYIGVIDSDPYTSSNLAYGATNVFFRSIRNFIIDTTAVSSSSSIAGIHWPVGQATSLQNIVFNMGSGSQHVGVFMESGSGGYLGDLTFNGGNIGLNVGNQQFTSKNLQFNGCTTGINQLWDWGWNYRGLTFTNCGTGINMAAGAPNNLNVGSMVVLDSTFTNTPVAISAGAGSGQSPASANSLILENIVYQNVNTIVQNANGAVALAGGSGTVTAWGQGSSYTPSGPNAFRNSIPVAGNGRPGSLVSGGKYYSASKPTYSSYDVSDIVSARSSGAKGDGHTDDTAALQNAINSAASAGKVFFFDHGDYIVTSTLTFPPGSKIVGESYSVILSSGSFFNNMNSPKPVVAIGSPGQSGSIQWSDMIVSTRGAQAGAILIQYNLAAPSGTPSGIWDVHTRIGGFAGSNLQVANCPTTPGTTVTPQNINTNCIAAFTSIHITPQSKGLYLENNWFWVADHDIDSSSNTQITIYAGRGLLDQSTAGPVWLTGTAVEHHSLYQYQFAGASNVYAGLIQTETAYYQPNPDATFPFTAVSSLNDPTFTGAATVSNGGYTIPNRNGWGLRILNSASVLVYGASHYSFFDNYSTSCSNQNNGEWCQSSIVSMEGNNNDITIYNLVTLGTHWPMSINGATQSLWSAGNAGYSQNFAWFTTNT